MVEKIKKAITDSGFNFRTWTGEKDSFIVENEGKEYRITVAEEPVSMKINIKFDYEDTTEVIPLTLSNIVKTFNRLKEDAGMIVTIDNKEYFFESMEDYYDDYLTCWDEDGTAMRSQRQTFLDRLISVR